ncbi:MAG: sulfite exporter TauE/SafE family protein, partial [Alphaproteobacteria bacterium]
MMDMQMYMVAEALALAGVGAVAGVLGGLLGIGGGVIIVPLLDTILRWNGVESGFALHMAVATSLACIMVTNLRGAKIHTAKGNVHWPFILRWAPGLLVGCGVGNMLALHLAEHHIALIFCLTLLPLLGNLMLHPSPADEVYDVRRVPPYILQPLGTIVGFVATVAGLGGAILAGPMMLRFGFSPRQTVGNASAVGLLVSTPAVLATLAHHTAPDAPAFTIGFVYLPAVVLVAGASLLLVPLGVQWSHHISARTTRWIFRILLSFSLLKVGGPYVVAF